VPGVTVTSIDDHGGDRPRSGNSGPGSSGSGSSGGGGGDD
jgi:hypothetical protein